jgi:hypothetical protein
MQGLPKRVNTYRDRGRRSRWGRTLSQRRPRHIRRVRQRSFGLEGALPVVGLRDHGRLAHAIVGIGLAVAAADRAEDLETESGHARACAGDVEYETRAGRMLAEKSVVALGAGKTAALLAEADCAGT